MSAKTLRSRSHRQNYFDRRRRSGLPSLTPMDGLKSNLPGSARRPPQAGLQLISLLVLALCAGPLYARAPKAPKHENSHHEIDQLEESWRNAILRSDTTAMSNLLADDYTAITPNGTLQTKQDTLANLRSGRVHFSRLDVSDRKVRFYGSTAIVTSRAQVRGNSGEGEISGNFRYTRVYVKNRLGKWKIVSFEASRIRQNRAFR